MLGDFSYQTTRYLLIQSLSSEWFTSLPSQLDGFGSDQILKSSNRRVDIETGQLIEIQHCFVNETRTSGKSHCPLPDNAFFTAKVVRFIRGLPDIEKALILYAYGDKQDWNSIIIISKYVWQEFIRRHKKFRKKKLDKLKGMLLLSLQEYKHFVLSGESLHPGVKIMNLLELNEHHWSRDWHPCWRSMLDILKTLDERSLILIYRKLHHKKVA